MDRTTHFQRISRQAVRRSRGADANANAETGQHLSRRPEKRRRLDAFGCSEVNAASQWKSAWRTCGFERRLFLGRHREHTTICCLGDL